MKTIVSPATNANILMTSEQLMVANWAALGKPPYGRNPFFAHFLTGSCRVYSISTGIQHYVSNDSVGLLYVLSGPHINPSFHSAAVVRRFIKAAPMPRREFWFCTLILLGTIRHMQERGMRISCHLHRAMCMRATVPKLMFFPTVQCQKTK